MKPKQTMRWLGRMPRFVLFVAILLHIFEGLPVIISDLELAVQEETKMGVCVGNIGVMLVENLIKLQRKLIANVRFIAMINVVVPFVPTVEKNVVAIKINPLDLIGRAMERVHILDYWTNPFLKDCPNTKVLNVSINQEYFSYIK